MFGVPIDELRQFGTVVEQLEDLDSRAHHGGGHRVTEEIGTGPLPEYFYHLDNWVIRRVSHI